MDALFTSFLLAALGEWGDKTQLLALAFGLRFGRPAPVLAGVAVGALLNALLAAAAACSSTATSRSAQPPFWSQWRSFTRA
jgi:putative Ca2+/H+ antiporter (TMEM165/GDT1 family)